MVDEITNGESPMQKDCVCMQLHVRMPGMRAKAAKSTTEVAAAALGTDDGMISLTKQIVDSDEYRRVRHCVGEMRAHLKTKSLPSPMLRGGFYMIPLPLIDQVEERLTGLRGEFDAYVSDFLQAYESGLVSKARLRLGDLFDEEDYPTSAQLFDAFGVETLYISLDVPGRLRTVNQALFEQERQRAEARWRNLEEEAVAVMRAEMKGFVDKMVEQLGHAEDGRKKAFRKGNVEKLAGFLESFDLRNVNDDQELGKLANTAKRLLNGVDVDSIRKDDKYRDAVHDTFAAVKDKLDKLVVDAPTRAITFAEEV